jgi:hypothetical protein
MMVLLITLLIVIIAYVISLYFTKPFRQIQRILPVNSQLEPKNEVDWIISSIDTILSEKESLEGLIESEMPQLETQFILNLFRNRISPEELKQGMQRFGHKLSEDSVYATLLIQLDNYGERQAIDKDLLLVAVNKLVEERIPQEDRMIPILLNDRTQATILIFEGTNEQENRRQVLEYAKTIIRTAREVLKLSVSVGISNFYIIG